MPNKPIVFPIEVAPLGAEFDPFFPIFHIVAMQLLEAFKDNLFGFSLDPVAIVPEPCLELYRKDCKLAPLAMTQSGDLMRRGMQRYNVASKRDGMLSNRDNAPSKRDSVPSKRDGMLSNRDNMPSKRDSVPSKGDSAPSKGDGVPSKGDGRPQRSRQRTLGCALQDTKDIPS